MSITDSAGAHLHHIFLYACVLNVSKTRVAGIQLPTPVANCCFPTIQTVIGSIPMQLPEF